MIVVFFVFIFAGCDLAPSWTLSVASFINGCIGPDICRMDIWICICCLIAFIEERLFCSTNFSVKFFLTYMWAFICDGVKNILWINPLFHTKMVSMSVWMETLGLCLTEHRNRSALLRTILSSCINIDEDRIFCG